MWVLVIVLVHVISGPAREGRVYVCLTGGCVFGALRGRAGIRAGSAGISMKSPGGVRSTWERAASGIESWDWTGEVTGPVLSLEGSHEGRTGREGGERPGGRRLPHRQEAGRRGLWRGVPGLA